MSADEWSRQMLFLFAHVFFFVGTLICALAPSMIVLIVGRAIAGVGGAGLFSMVSGRAAGQREAHRNSTTMPRYTFACQTL